MTPETTSAIRMIGVAIAIVLLGVAAPVAAQPAPSAWPMYQHDPQHTGRSPHTGPLTTPTECWQYDGGQRRAAATLGVDGTVYLTVSRRPLIALDPTNGSELWPNSPGNSAAADRSQAAVDVSGRIYVGTRGNRLVAFDPDGSSPWFVQVNPDPDGPSGDVSTPPTIGPDGTIYMASDSLGSGKLYGINPDGSEKWMQVPGGGIKNVSPALSLDGNTLYVTTQGRTLFARVAATGAPLWSVSVQAGTVGTRAANFSPVVGADGTIYFATRAGVFAQNPDGSPRWTFPVSSGTFNAPPALGADGTLYAGWWGRQSILYALDGATGAVRWQYPMPKPSRFRDNPPVVGADGTIYVASGRDLFAFDPNGDGSGGGLLKWGPLPLGGWVEAGPTIGGEGLLYAGAGSRLYALSDQGCP